MNDINQSLIAQILKKSPDSCFFNGLEGRLSNAGNMILPERFSEESVNLFLDAEKHPVMSQGHLLFLFRMRIVSEALVYKRKDWLYFLSQKKYLSLITGIPDEKACLYSWTFIPCLFANQSDSFVRFILCGTINSSDRKIITPEWGRQLMDHDFSQSVRNAFDLLHESSGITFELCCVPVCVFSGSALFNGDSAGLAIYIGIRSLLEKRKYPSKTAATGRIRNGDIQAAGFINQKMERAKNEGFSFFVYPSENRMIDTGSAYPLQCFQADSPDMAFIIPELESLGTGTVNIIYDCLSSPEKFASLCGSLPEISLTPFQNRIENVANEISASSGLFKKFIPNFRQLVKSSKYRTASDISKSFNRAVESSTSIDPVSMAGWFIINLEMANHEGKVDLASQYLEKARICMPEALRTTEGRQLFNWLGNYEFVHKRHNYYDFRTEMPEKFPALIETAEKIFAITTADIQGASEPALASIYGTIAQNYAFCGPDFINESISCSIKSIETFGGVHSGEIPEHAKEDCLRQYSYMTYAFLDAENFTEAERHLLLYLERNSFNEIMHDPGRLSEWQHSVLIRFLASVYNESFFNNYLSFCQNRQYDFVADRHPWQLWFYNMAKCAVNAGMTELSMKFAYRSLEICESEASGDTVRVMSLLPLTILYKKENHILDSKIIKAKNLAINLNRNHFLPLNGSEPEDIMRTVSDNTDVLFPFSYR